MKGSHDARTLWEKVSGNLQEWYSEAVEWTGEKARIGVKKVDIVGIQHNIKRNMAHLGGRVYDLLQRGESIDNDEQVQAVVSTLRGLEQELASREREIDLLKAGRADEEAEAEAMLRASKAEVVVGAHADAHATHAGFEAGDAPETETYSASDDAASERDKPSGGPG